jgi:ectoine hydroxylase-related dioxygenase (phytanoyl-CoA dioxygenase family)
MNFYIILLIALILYLFFFITFTNNETLPRDNTYDLIENGFHVYKNMLSSDEIDKIKLDIKNSEINNIKKYIMNQSKLKSIINNTNYVFQDYIWIIEKSSVHTCHRDNNGSFFNKGQKHPSYTVLIYLENMYRCLGVIPSSHKIENKNKYNINLTNEVKDIICHKGDVIIFNSNLIHVGTLNENNNDYLRIQMKISHKDDLDVLNYYQNYNKILNKKNNRSYFIKNIQKNISCMIPSLSDLTQSKNMGATRVTDNGVNIGHIQKLFSYFYYGDSSFFDVPNIK